MPALRWADRAGTGTTVGRDAPLTLTGRHVCHWRDYSQVGLADGRTAVFRHLLLDVRAGEVGSPPPQGAGQVA